MSRLSPLSPGVEIQKLQLGLLSQIIPGDLKGIQEV